MFILLLSPAATNMLIVLIVIMSILTLLLSIGRYLDKKGMLDENEESK